MLPQDIFFTINHHFPASFQPYLPQKFTIVAPIFISYPLVNIQKVIENGPVEIVDLPMNNDDFPQLCLFTRVYINYLLFQNLGRPSKHICSAKHHWKKDTYGHDPGLVTSDTGEMKSTSSRTLPVDIASNYQDASRCAHATFFAMFSCEFHSPSRLNLSKQVSKPASNMDSLHIVTPGTEGSQGSQGPGGRPQGALNGPTQLQVVSAL